MYELMYYTFRKRKNKEINRLEIITPDNQGRETREGEINLCHRLKLGKRDDHLFYRAFLIALRWNKRKSKAGILKDEE